MTAIASPPTHVGRRYVGRTNRQLVAGLGRYVGDIEVDEAPLHMAVLRSPHAHARIRAIDTSDSRKVEGVVRVVTGSEVNPHMNPIPPGWDTSSVNARQVDWFPLCGDRARYVGEAVAAVVAETRHQAYLAMERIKVDYEVIKAVTTLAGAVRPDSPLVEPEWGTNTLVGRLLEVGDVDTAFATSPGVISGRMVTHRGTGVPIEPRGLLVDYDADRDLVTLWASTQNPHPLRVYLAQTLGIAESRIRVIQPHVGGAFGLKQPTFQEEPLIVFLGMEIGRPIKWIEERQENFNSTGHAREMTAEYRASYDHTGLVTGLEIDITADVGAPTALVGWGMTFAASGLIPGGYLIPNTRVRLTAVATNKTPWNAYRGFGKDIANLWLEGVMDQVARAAGIDRLEVRLRNLLQPGDLPFARERGGVIDSGDYPKMMRRVAELIDYGGFPARRATALESGRRIGMGIAYELTPEGCAMPGSVMISAYDGATVRVGPTGEVTVLSGITSPGNGNETALAQIAADGLGARFEDVRVIQGDTTVCPWGLGNYSSRGVIIGG
jgi:carbon-monoxide dehydrogenase large subunit